MVDYCLKCEGQLHGMIHTCSGHKVVLDPVAYREEMGTTNPLDRLTVGETITIYGEDTDAALRRAEELLADANAMYFQSPLAYRIEFQSISAELGFRPTFDGSAILTEGHTNDDWGKVLELINEMRGPSIILLSESETYQCRLVSHDSEGRPYVWSVKRLEYQKGTGWVFLDWG